MWNTLTILFLTATAGTALAGTDGYLRHTLPLAMRFAELPPAPPLVNELILAMDQPAATTDPAAGNSGDESPATPDPQVFNSPSINDLIAGTASTASNPDDVRPSFSVSTVPADGMVQFPDIPLSSPNEPETEAQTMQNVIMMFTPTKNEGKRNDGPVLGMPMTAPSPSFNPPLPSSKSTYTVE